VQDGFHRLNFLRPPFSPLRAVYYAPLRAVYYAPLRAVCYAPLRAVCYAPLRAVCYAPLRAVCYAPLRAVYYAPLRAVDGPLRAADIEPRLRMGVSSSAAAERHGELRDLEVGGVATWNALRDQWMTPDAFWRAFTQASAGHAWGARSDLPVYMKVRERGGY
jgi:hypothetical protein